MSDKRRTGLLKIGPTSLIIFVLLSALTLLWSGCGRVATKFYNRGNEQKAKGDLDGAIASCTFAILLNPKDAAAYTLRGFAKQEKGDQKGANADFAQAAMLKGR